MLSSQHDEAINWKSKCQSQTRLITAKDTEIKKLELGMTKAKADLTDFKVQHIELINKYNGLQNDHIIQANYILELQSTIAKGVEESGQL